MPKLYLLILPSSFLLGSESFRMKAIYNFVLGYYKPHWNHSHPCASNNQFLNEYIYIHTWANLISEGFKTKSTRTPKKHFYGTSWKQARILFSLDMILGIWQSKIVSFQQLVIARVISPLVSKHNICLWLPLLHYKHWKGFWDSHCL